MERAALFLSAPPAVAFSDGLGERRIVADPTGRETLEWTCLRSELASVPSFEFALRERVGRLASFRDPAFGRVRSVERLNDPDATLTVVSDHVDGVRLSDVLANVEKLSLPLDINSALRLTRQLVAAMALLHESARDAAHAALGPERLVLTPDGRLIVVEYVCGSALEQLRFAPERYWTELRLPLPRSAGQPRFDQRTDVLQIGLTVLALVLGRTLREDEFPSRVGEVLASAWAVSARGGFEPLPAGLRGWLGRALQLDPRSAFTTAIDARTELDKVLGEGDTLASQASLDTFLTLYRTETHTTAKPSVVPTPVSMAAPAPVPVVPTRPVAPAAPVVASVAPSVVEVPAPIAIPRQAATPSPSVAAALPSTPVSPAAHVPSVDAKAVTPPAAIPTPAPATAPASLLELRATEESKANVDAPIAAHAAVLPVAPASVAAHASVSRAFAYAGDSEADDDSDDADARRSAQSDPWADTTLTIPAETPLWRRPAVLGGGVVLMGLLVGGAMAVRTYFVSSAAAGHVGTLVVTSSPSGAATVVDGEARGMTPLTLTLSPGQHTVELRSGGGAPRTIPVMITQGAQTSQYIELPKSGPTVGQLQVRTEPAGAELVVDGVAHGRTPALINELAAGEHTVLVTSELGSMRQTVTVEAGATASLLVPLGAAEGAPLSGWVSITAPVEIQVFEKDRLLGSSQSDRIMVAAGKHELDLVNDSLGFRTSRAVQVAAGKTQSMKVELPQSTIALNATPWAEVWIDGEKIGDTPIGNYSLTIGAHDVVFRHPELGEQHHNVLVTLKEPARLSVDLRKK